MTHSHDTSTPAMSAESVPSEEFVLVPREPTERMLKAADGWTDLIDAAGENTAESRRSEFRIAWKAMVEAAPTLSASHLAKEGGEAEVVDWLWWGRDEADKEHVSFGRWQKHPCQHRYKLAAIQPTEHDHPQHSPALAKGGDVVRSHDVLDEAKINALPLPLIARFAGDKDWLPIHDIGIDAPLCRIDVSGKLEPRRFSEIMELKDGDGVIHNPDDFYLDADTPTEGPASQTEGMGGDAEARRKRASELMAPLMELSEDELILLRHSLPVETLARLRATLTPPETAEAVPGDLTAVLVQGVQMLSAHIERFHDHEEETEEKVDIRGIKDHLEGAALVSVLGSIQTPSSQPTNAATASHPAPATDERERLVEALRAAGWMVAVHNDYRLNGEAHTFWLWTKGDRAVKGEGRTDAEALEIVARAALATEASR